MAKTKNNKGKAAGSGTVSNARRERYKKACQERDKFLETSTDLEKAKELQRAHQKKQEGGPQAGSSGAAPSMEMKEKKEEAAPCQKEQEAAPCQKEQEAAPCQKEQAKQHVDVKVEKKGEAAPCQKEQKIAQEQQLDVKVEKKKEEAATCQKEQAKKEAEAPAPCQKEAGAKHQPSGAGKKKKMETKEPTHLPKRRKKGGNFFEFLKLFQLHQFHQLCTARGQKAKT